MRLVQSDKVYVSMHYMQLKCSGMHLANSNADANRVGSIRVGLWLSIFFFLGVKFGVFLGRVNVCDGKQQSDAKTFPKNISYRQ